MRSGGGGGTPATWYVATTGADAASCGSTAAAPCASIGAAVAKAAAGDTIEVATGT